MKLGILGGGQLGMMMCQAAKKIDIETIVFSDSTDSPAVNFSNKNFINKYDNFTLIDEFIKECDVITFEFENIPFETLNYIQNKKSVLPSPNINNIVQDRLTEKFFINDLGIPTVPYFKIDNKNDLSDISSDFFPSILKTRRLGYDGKGQQVISKKKDIFKLDQNEYILEKKIKLKQEISVVTVRYQDEKMFSYLPIDNEHKDQILFKSTSPATINDSVREKSLKWSKEIIAKLNYIGVICVEYFIDENDELFVNEIAPRVHNSGHLTIESYNVSQFESHVRAVCKLEPIEPKLIHPAEMRNILGKEIYKYRGSNLPKNTYFHDYLKDEAKVGRKMGHLTKIFT